MDYEHFYSANLYYKKTYGEKVYRLALDGGMTCPNRDGRVAFGGCTFCSEKGSGDFTSCAERDFQDFTARGAGGPEAITEQVKRQIEKAKKLVASKAGRLYIAYFQSFTNTYAPIDYLDALFSAALETKDTVALSIATRPDCVDESTVRLLLELKEKYHKDIYIELGLQTINDGVASSFNRGYDYPVFLNALRLLQQAEIPVIVHMILGLPCETEDDILKSVSTVSALGIHGIKLSLLHILKGTAMEQEYSNFPERFHITDKQVYIRILCRCIEHIPENVVIYRITGDAPKSLLVAPEFTADKKMVLNSIHKYMKEHNIIQGRYSG